jgi:voltage-gated potassium channel
MEAGRKLERERWRLLHQFVRIMEPLVTGLGGVWLVLLVLEFTRGSTPMLQQATNAIWAVFLVDFAAEFIVAPRKLLYLQRHWLAALSLAIPALRFLRFVRITRVARAARAVREARLARTIGSLNRAIGALRATFERRGVAYISVTTVVVTCAGAAAMYAFERGVPNPAGIHDYPSALWWTAMMMTTMGSAYWPETGEGRILCLLLALYAFAVFGYVTATLASYFIDRDAARGDASVAGGRDIEALVREIAALRRAIADAVGPRP